MRGRGLCGFHYAKERKRLHAAGTFASVWVPVEPVLEHVAALRAAGLGWPRIAELSGLSPLTVAGLAKPGRRAVNRRTEAAILGIDVPASPLAPELSAGFRVPIVGTRRRLRALAAIGYSQDHLLADLGMQPRSCALSKVYTGADYCTARRAREIAALFDRYRLRPYGPSARAKQDARRKGWPPPFAWDDDTIEDPTVGPDFNAARMAARRAEARRRHDTLTADIIADYRSVGRSDAEVADVLGLRLNSFYRRQQGGRAEDAEVAS